MKKKIIGIVMIAVIAVAAGWNMIQNKNEITLSDLVLANVEALASDCEKINGSCWINRFNDWECCDSGLEGCAPCDY